MLRIILLVLALLVGTAGADEIKGSWRFPSDIAVADGKLYVVDGLNDRVAIYDLYGTHLGDVKVKNPFGIYVAEGMLYITSQEGRIYVADEYGNLEKVLKVKGRPIDVVKVGDRLFVSNGKDNSLDVYSADGTFLKRIGSKGSGPSEFLGIFLLSASSDLILAVDAVNARIQEFSLEGRFVRAFGVFGIEEGKLFRPKGVAFCGGKIVVSDCITGAVQMFDVHGGFERVIAKDLEFPTAVACYGDTVFVLQPLKGRVSTFRIRGAER